MELIALSYTSPQIPRRAFAIVRADILNPQEAMGALLGKVLDLQPAEWSELFKEVQDTSPEATEADHLNGEAAIINNIIPFGPLLGAGPMAGVALASVPPPPLGLDDQALAKRGNGWDHLHRNGQGLEHDKEEEKHMDEQERIAIMQHDGQLPQDEAERLAARTVKQAAASLHPRRTPSSTKDTP